MYLCICIISICTMLLYHALCLERRLIVKRWWFCLCSLVTASLVAWITFYFTKLRFESSARSASCL